MQPRDIICSMFICKYCTKPASHRYQCKGPCRRFMHYTCTVQAYYVNMIMNIVDSNFYCVSCSIDRVNLNLSLINFYPSVQSSTPLIPPKLTTASSSICSTSPTNKSPDVKNQIDTPGPSGNSNRNFLHPSVYSCKYCKNSCTDNCFRCKGPCRKLFHYTCILQAYRDHITMNLRIKNFYCVSCSIDKLNQNLCSINSSPSAESPRKFLKLAPITTLPTPIRASSTTRFKSPVKRSPCVRCYTSGPLKNSKINPSKTDTSTCSIPPIEKSPDVKNQIDIPRPSGNSNTNPPEVNVSTCSASPTNKSPDVKTLQVPKYYMTEEYYDFQEHITQVQMHLQECTKYLKKHSNTQVKCSVETSVDILSTLSTELKKTMQNIDSVLLDIQKEIQTLEAQYLIEEIEIWNSYIRNSKLRDKEDIE
ncbi:uncharacterized protein [Temnothorax nylanderi]|uniref:uncharacterized protein n=1 Tax=Temnothorax nylanderi TaxID=102681 RepID=UPI003A870B87